MSRRGLKHHSPIQEREFKYFLARLGPYIRRWTVNPIPNYERLLRSCPICLQRYRILVEDPLEDNPYEQRVLRDLIERARNEVKEKKERGEFIPIGRREGYKKRGFDGASTKKIGRAHV